MVGMVTVHDQAPFSVTEKMQDPHALKQLGDRLIEARLLAIEPGQRHSLVFAGLNWLMLQHASHGGYSHLLISGHSENKALYERFGFRLLGPSVDQWGCHVRAHRAGPQELAAEHATNHDTVDRPEATAQAATNPSVFCLDR